MTVDEHRPRPQPWRPGPCSPAADALAGLASLSWPRGDGCVDAVFRSTAAGGTYSAEGLVPQGPGASSRAQAFCPPDPSSGLLSARGR